MSVLRLNLAVLVAATLLTGLTAAHAQNLAGPSAGSTVAAKPPAPLRVAVYAHEAPLIFKTGEKFSGVEAELARGLGEELGRPVQFVETTLNDLIPSLLDDRADIVMSGLSLSKLREVRVAFCVPYLRSGQVPLCRRGELATYNNNEAFFNLRSTIGVVGNTTADVLVRSEFTYAHVVTFPTLADAVAALRDKKSDLLILDYPLALWQNAENEASLALIPMFLNQEDYGWAVRKDDDALRTAANAYVAKIKESGKLTEIVRKWIPSAADGAIGPVPLPNAPDALPVPTVVTPSAAPASVVPAK